MSFADRYELSVPLGRTPGGVVWRATRKKDDRPVAIAIADGQGLMDEALFERLRERFRHDLGALTRAKRGHYPEVHEVDEDDAANPYAVMALVEGESIDGLELSTEALGKVLDGVLRALEAAHRVRVFHGDVEPGNILYDEASGAAHLVGFGLNRSLAGAEGWGDDVEENLWRSAAHRAPELGPGELATDPRADLYSVGAVLHHALAGEAPKPGRSIAEVAPGLGATMVKLVDRALDAKPQGRFASAWAMRTALNAAVRMAGRGERPPAKSSKRTIPGGMKAPDVPMVPKVPAPKASSRPPASRVSSRPPTGTAPPPPPKSEAPKGKGQSTVPIAIAPPPSNAPDTGAGSASSIPPPVVGVQAHEDSHLPTEALAPGREDTQSLGVEDLMPSEAPRSSVPPPVPTPSADSDEVDLPFSPGPASFLRSPLGLAAIALLAIGVGWLLGRATAPETPPEVSQVAAAPTETEAPTAAPEPEPEPAPEPEPEPEAPEPLWIGELPEGVDALVDGAPYDADEPPTLAPDGRSLPLVIERGEQRVGLELARDAEGGLRLNVTELSEPPEPEPAPAVAAPSPMTGRARTTRRARQPSPMGSSSGGLMRPGIAYDPGF